MAIDPRQMIDLDILMASLLAETLGLEEKDRVSYIRPRIQIAYDTLSEANRTAELASHEAKFGFPGLKSRNKMKALPQGKSNNIA